MALPFESESNFRKHGEFDVSQNDLIRQISMKRVSSDNDLPRVRNQGYRTDTFGGRCRQRADKFRNFLSTAICTAFNRVPSVVLVFLAFILILVMISSIPLAFYLSYSNSDALVVTSNNTDEVIKDVVPVIPSDPEIPMVTLIPDVNEDEQLYNRSCLASEFKDETLLCSNGKSYPKKYACSGFISDCSGFCSDCDQELSFTCGNKTCISKKLVCNGRDDCGNGADEEGCDCTGKHMCRAKSLNGLAKCFGDEQRCDGIANCPDHEDEENCTSCANNPVGFYCTASQKCILSIRRCDGHDDCHNGEDEIDCSCEECKYMFPLYGCSSSKRCFRMNQVCQPNSICPNPTDEDHLFCKSRIHMIPLEKTTSNIF